MGDSGRGKMSDLAAVISSSGRSVLIVRSGDNPRDWIALAMEMDICRDPDLDPERRGVWTVEQLHRAADFINKAGGGSLYKRGYVRALFGGDEARRGFAAITAAGVTQTRLKSATSKGRFGGNVMQPNDGRGGVMRQAMNAAYALGLLTGIILMGTAWALLNI